VAADLGLDNRWLCGPLTAWRAAPCMIIREEIPASATICSAPCRSWCRATSGRAIPTTKTGNQYRARHQSAAVRSTAIVRPTESPFDLLSDGKDTFIVGIMDPSRRPAFTPSIPPPARSRRIRFETPPPSRNWSGRPAVAGSRRVRADELCNTPSRTAKSTWREVNPRASRYGAVRTPR